MNIDERNYGLVFCYHVIYSQGQHGVSMSLLNILLSLPVELLATKAAVIRGQLLGAKEYVAYRIRIKIPTKF